MGQILVTMEAHRSRIPQRRQYNADQTYFSLVVFRVYNWFENLFYQAVYCSFRYAIADEATGVYVKSLIEQTTGEVYGVSYCRYRPVNGNMEVHSACFEYHIHRLPQRSKIKSSSIKQKKHPSTKTWNAHEQNSVGRNIVFSCDGQA